MTQLKDFKDLVVWQKSYALTKLIYALTDRPPFKRDVRLLGEIRGSAITVGSKIAAAFAVRGNGYANECLNLSKAACNGLKMQLTLVHQQGWLTLSEYEELATRIVEIRQMLFDLEQTFDFWYNHPHNEDTE
ncbi:MAG: four helix bundle protein [Anaerolineae bacterium]